MSAPNGHAASPRCRSSSPVRAPPEEPFRLVPRPLPCPPVGLPAIVGGCGVAPQSSVRARPAGASSRRAAPSPAFLISAPLRSIGWELAAGAPPWLAERRRRLSRLGTVAASRSGQRQHIIATGEGCALEATRCQRFRAEVSRLGTAQPGTAAVHRVSAPLLRHDIGLQAAAVDCAKPTSDCQYHRLARGTSRARDLGRELDAAKPTHVPNWDSCSRAPRRLTCSSEGGIHCRIPRPRTSAHSRHKAA